MKPLDALHSLGSGSEPPAEAKQRVYGSVLAALEIAAASAAAAAAPKPSATVPPAAPPLLAGMASSKALLLAAGVWLTGGVTGAALFGALRPQTVRVVYVDRPLLASAVVAPAPEPAPNLGLPQASASAPRGSATTRAAAAPSGSNTNQAGSELAAERVLLDRARANAASGEPERVLELADRHRREFPSGHLAEEREALAIRALRSLGRTDEARARADAFRVAFPKSFLTPVIDSALSAP